MKKKTLIFWIILFAVLLVASTTAAVYAYLAASEFKYGTFNVDITSKGVDTLEIPRGNPIELAANWKNFNIGTGHDITGSSNLDVKLQTTSPESNTYCYELSLSLPEKNDFVYSKEGYPEIVISVKDKTNNIVLINNLDITTKTGKINIPTVENGEEYKFSINTTKKVTKINSYESTLTLKWYPDVDQIVNIEKDFYVKLEANIVDC